MSRPPRLWNTAWPSISSYLVARINFFITSSFAPPSLGFPYGLQIIRLYNIAPVLNLSGAFAVGRFHVWSVSTKGTKYLIYNRSLGGKKREGGLCRLACFSAASYSPPIFASSLLLQTTILSQLSVSRLSIMACLWSGLGPLFSHQTLFSFFLPLHFSLLLVIHSSTFSPTPLTLSIFAVVLRIFWLKRKIHDFASDNCDSQERSERSRSSEVVCRRAKNIWQKDAADIARARGHVGVFVIVGRSVKVDQFSLSFFSFLPLPFSRPRFRTVFPRVYIHVRTSICACTGERMHKFTNIYEDLIYFVAFVVRMQFHIHVFFPVIVIPFCSYALSQNFAEHKSWARESREGRNNRSTRRSKIFFHTVVSFVPFFLLFFFPFILFFLSSYGIVLSTNIHASVSFGLTAPTHSHTLAYTKLLAH